MIPETLAQAIAAKVSQIPQRELVKASTFLTQRYRNKEVCKQLTDSERYAYLAVRLPATYAVISRVLQEILKIIPDLHIDTLLDIGAGPGTAMWAIAESFPDIKQIDLIELDPQWIKLGKELALNGNEALKQATWQQKKLEDKQTPFEAHDMVILSYVIGELSDNCLEEVVLKTWQAAEKIAIFIEPGTPEGFKKIWAVREKLIALQANLVAPCPHSVQCPLAAKGDWCHFSQRLERSNLHQEVKNVSVGYEDEKYSYIVASKFPTPHPQARIVRHPQIKSGHVSFTLCTEQGLQQKILSRRHGQDYKEARKLEWGDFLGKLGKHDE